MVVAIISLLAALTMPNLMRLSYKSRRAEAFGALRGISIAQATYFGEIGQYAPTFDELGFELSGGQRIDPTTIAGPHYTYTLTTMARNGINNGNYRATATGDIDPTDAVLDIIIIENQLTVVGP
jgi:type II secretory pathway pseudopilin PulG